METKISIIMPVYNGELFLNDSIKSVLNQSFINYELLCVDDGSTDRSVEIIESFSKIDNRVVLLKKNNGGPGSALNYGIEKANGEFLCFLDQDDKYHVDYLLRMYSKITTEKLDVVICNAYFWDNDNIIRIPYKSFLESAIDINNKSNLKILRDYYIPQWLKIARKSLYITNHITFPDKNNKAHDIPVHYMLMSSTKRVGYIKDCLYYHRYHENQISFNMDERSTKLQSLLDVLEWSSINTDISKNKVFRFLSIQLAKISISIANDLNFFDRLKDIVKNNNYYNFLDRLYLFYYLLKKKKEFLKKDKFLKLKTPNCIVGRNSYCADNIKIACSNTTIGNFCSIGSNVQLGNGDHPLNYLSTSPYFYFDTIGWKKDSVVSHNEYWNYKGVKIYNDVWVGDNVVVMNGVKIGNGAVIGMNSVVTKDVPPFAIVAGVPAKIIRYRFDKDIIDKLEKLKWWYMSDDILKDCPYDNINKAIDYLESRSKL